MQKVRLFYQFVQEIWLIKKPCNLIGWRDFGPYLRNKNFPKYGICAGTQQKCFHYRTCTTSYGFLALCQNSEKTNDTIPRKRLDRRTDRPYFIGPFRLPPGVQKADISKYHYGFAPKWEFTCPVGRGFFSLLLMV